MIPIAKNIKPNSICKNPSCQQLFVSCSYCAKSENWRSCCCSIECYQTYINLVAEKRSKSKPVDLYPDRIDISKEEVKKLIHETPIEEVKAIAAKEIADMGYADVLDGKGFGGTIDKINEDLRLQEKIQINEVEIEKPKPKTRGKKKLDDDLGVE